MRGIRLLALLALVLGLSVVMPAPPAQGGVGTCGGEWDVRFAQGLMLPEIGTPRWNTSFSMNMIIGACGGGHSGSATGTLDGNEESYCGLATGTGVMDGHGFSFRIIGDAMYFFGGVLGRLTIVWDAPGGQSCIGGAANFLAVGTLLLI